MCGDRIVCISPMAGRSSRAKAIFRDKSKYKMNISWLFLDILFVTFLYVTDDNYL